MPWSIYFEDMGTSILRIQYILKDKFKYKNDTDLVDRINFAYTPSVIFAFATIIIAKQYFGTPIQCWLPAEYDDSWEVYSEFYCFVENTYFVGFDEKVFPRTVQERESRELKYYQWVPIILCAQMLLFLLPKSIWSSFNWRTGLSVNAILESTKLVRFSDTQDVRGKIQYDFTSNHKDTEDYVYSLIKFNQEKHAYASNRLFGGYFKGTYVTNLYLFCKFLNLVNVLVQIVWLNMFFGHNYTFWGIGVAKDLMKGVQWQESGHFPRVTYCDVQIREIGANTHRHTFQCVLMINMFNEKIFITIWFWLFFLLFLNVYNLFLWVYMSYYSGSIKSFINKCLNYENVQLNDEDLEKFIEAKLFKDMTTLFRLMEYNCGGLQTGQIVKGVYDRYKEELADREDAKKQQLEPGRGLNSTG